MTQLTGGLCWAASGDAEAGAGIYQRQCAVCHGPSGEGTDSAPDPLIGDRSIAELASLITETMPQDAPETCTGDAAAQVSAYIHAEFYSPIAQARRSPPRVEFAHLTVPQYRNALADLVGSFGPSAPDVGSEPGLHGRYLSIRDGPMDEHSFTRTDRAIDFDFGEGSPNAEKIEPEQFGMWWHGAVLAPDTGDYEFIVETTNGIRLWVNDHDAPLIDGSVRSGENVTWRETVPLIGGRYYLLKMEFFKSKAAMEKVAAVRLKWKPPHGVEEVVPADYLRPHEVPEVYVVRTPFPPDDRSQGYERGSLVSKEWDAATTRASLETTTAITAQLDRFLKAEDGDRAAQVEAFCVRFAERAFRRPLSADQQDLLIQRVLAGAPDEQTGVKRVVLLVLKSPRFLFRETARDSAGFDDYDTAAWLSFALWDSLPDNDLQSAAGRGELRTREQLIAQGQRMLADPRAAFKVRAMLHQWLNLDRLHRLEKNPELFPAFDGALATDLRRSLDLLLRDVVWSDSSDFRDLLLSPSLYVNRRMESFYGVEMPASDGFERVESSPPRWGVLTHPYLLAGLAYRDTTSPIHRGVFLSRNMLGRFLKPPPDAVTPDPPELHPGLTTRERVTLQTSAEQCRACHGMINNLGFALEDFDAAGRYRTEDVGRPVDSSGSYATRQGDTVEFRGVDELATFLAGSPEAHEAFVAQMFRQLTKQPIQAFGPDRLTERRIRFAETGYSIRTLLVELTAESALWMRELGKDTQTAAVNPQ